MSLDPRQVVPSSVPVTPRQDRSTSSPANAMAHTGPPPARLGTPPIGLTHTNAPPAFDDDVPAEDSVMRSSLALLRQNRELFSRVTEQLDSLSARMARLESSYSPHTSMGTATAPQPQSYSIGTATALEQRDTSSSDAATAQDTPTTHTSTGTATAESDQASPSTRLAPQAGRPPHMGGDDDDPVAQYHRLPQSQRDAFAKTMKRFNISISEFLDEQGLKAIMARKAAKDAAKELTNEHSPPTSSSTAKDLERIHPATTTTEETPSASTSAPAPTHPSSPPSPPLILSTTPTHILQCKPDYLPKFHGDPSQLEDWIYQVQAISRTYEEDQWKRAVARCVPLVLKDQAMVWYTGLTAEEAAALMTVNDWCEALREGFPVNTYEQRRQARARAWHAAKEAVSTYFHDKLRLLRSSYGAEYAEGNLVHDILDALPPTFRVMLRLPRREETTLKLLKREITEWEPLWRELYPISASPRTPLTSLGTSPSTPRNTSAASRSVGMARAPSAPLTAPATPLTKLVPMSSTPMPRGATPSSSPIRSLNESLSANYDPSRITPAADGKPRTYQRPDNDQVMMLKRNCSRCNEDHFDFEHRHIHPVPQVRLAAPQQYEDEGDVEDAGVEDGEALLEMGEEEEAAFC